jgi:hypothetical protein
MSLGRELRQMRIARFRRFQSALAAKGRRTGTQKWMKRQHKYPLGLFDVSVTANTRQQ